MKALKIIGIIIVIIAVICSITAWQLGFFTRITVLDRQEGGIIVAGIDFKGDYSKVGEPMMKVDQQLRNAGIKSTRGFGIYYDNPQTVPSSSCRSFIGNVIEEKDYPRLEEIKKLGFRIDTIEKKSSFVVEFPYKNKMSFFVGPLRAYPVLSKKLQTSGCKPSLALELYDMSAKMTYYIMQYEK
jgi:hypothetical protein